MKRLLRESLSLSAVGFACALVLGVVVQSDALAHVVQAGARPASVPHAAKPEFPRLSLPEPKSHGQRAIDLLGDRLPEVAAWYGKSPEEFRAQLLQDRRLKIDARGRLFVEDEIDAPVPAEPSPAASSSISGSLLPLDQTFSLHSKPGAPRTVYLNFKGAQLTNTAWNGSTATLTAVPFDLDGVPYAFSNTELERIQYIWQRVAEDFAPFDVNVTTEAPAAEMLTRSSSSDGTFGTTVLITKRSGVYSCSCGGVAYIGIFDDTSDFYKPALVFYDALGSGGEKAVAEAISHEAGHNVGLLHDGNSTAGYYTGHGTGATGWAPIMGVGYNRELVQWSKGEYLDANNVQDDYVVMSNNGLPVRADDHGNTIGTASPLKVTSAGSTMTLEGMGVVERPSDVDVFSFSSAAGAMSFTLATAARSANLDALIELRNSAGALLASANPLEALPATLSWTAPSAGTYFITVQGIGKGDPLTTGYTDYGSLGQYRLAGTVPSTGTSVAPVAVVSASPMTATVPLTSTFTSSGSYDPDGTIVAYEWNFGDGSPVVAGATASHLYTTAGSYTATLKLTDNSGLTSLKSVQINAQSTVVDMRSGVADIAMSVVVANTKSGHAQARAAVKVTDHNKVLLPGATVTGVWSGLVSGTVSGVTGSNGVVVLQSPNAKKSGTFRFSVTGITAPGYRYDSSLNVESADAITR